MTKTFCDRCGAEIHEGKCAWLSRRLVYTKFRLIPHRTREDWDNEDKYLCPQCEKEYIKWFEQGSNADKSCHLS